MFEKCEKGKTDARAEGQGQPHKIPKEEIEPVLPSPSPSPLPLDNEDETIIEMEAIRNVGRDSGIVCYCAGVECVFEMILYRYKDKQERRMS